MFHWKVLARLSEEQLGALDVAEVNLACIEGLPGAANLPYAECLDRLNHYARCVRHYTERRLPEFREEAEGYTNSEAIFRIVCMITLLRSAFGIRYNPAKMAAEAEFEPADTFIHGALLGEGGTCASLPVIYAAVGRRLGYPLKLVGVKRHLLVRWEEASGERFNIEVNNTSMDTPSDGHYRRGLYETEPWEEEAFCYLRSKTPKMELAGFLMGRGFHWSKLGKHKEAVESFLWAHSLAPHNRMYSYCAREAMEAWQKKLSRMTPLNAAEMTVDFPPLRRWPDALPTDVGSAFMAFEATEACLTEPGHQAWWEALRRSNGERPKDMPRKIELRWKY
jgi:hypothetical protein